MRRKSHYCLGVYLAEQYMSNVSEHCIRAFLFGCTQPDVNPSTYVKGSIRHQWMRGHNYHNAKKYIRKISQRLERKNKLSIWDYYTLGKLIHYTADAFTFAHNKSFRGNLHSHRKYEARLQEYFLIFLRDSPVIEQLPARSIMEVFYLYHREYSRKSAHIHTDASYILSASCRILTILFLDYKIMELCL